MSNEVGLVAKVLADGTRSQILLSLLDGRARTGSELARHVGIASSTASEHLGTLLDAGLVRVQPQGRHRYWRLRDAHVASLLETLAVTAAHLELAPPPAPATLATARSCYDHLAGRLGVTIFEHLVVDGVLTHIHADLTVTNDGARRLEALGIDMDAVTAPGRPAARACLDWTERKDHLAGRLGAALFERLMALAWIRHGTRPRSIEVTSRGRDELRSHFGWAG